MEFREMLRLRAEANLEQTEQQLVDHVISAGPHTVVSLNLLLEDPEKYKELGFTCKEKDELLSRLASLGLSYILNAACKKMQDEQYPR